MAVAAVQNDYASLAASLSGSGAASAAKSSVTEMSDRFLKLLVTQLKNQDPMNPMDNAQMTSQLAQMSTVEGVNKLNDSLDALKTQFQASQVIQGASLVGRQVLAEGATLNLSAAGAAGGMVLDSAADSVKVQILDANGSVVNTLDLGRQGAGLARFAWDGNDSNGAPLPEGTYGFKVQATAAGKDVSAATYSLGGVLSVALNGNAMDVEVSGLGNRGMDQIKQIF